MTYRISTRLFFALVLQIALLAIASPSLVAQGEGPAKKAEKKETVSRDDQMAVLRERLNQRVVQIIDGAPLSAWKVDEVGPIVTRFAYQEMVLRSKLARTKDQEQRKELIPEVRKNVEKTVKELSEIDREAGKAFRAFIRKEREERTAARADAAKSGGKGK